jgi:class 3 adenylate cyclase
MSVNPVKRKLAAILAADAVGYSRMMAADEEGTMKVLAAHRSVIDGIIQFHEGRIINTAGDSVLAEFASPTQAVRCAVEIQDALKTRNDTLPEGRRMHFRIGVNLGDVMVKGDDLLGDGVNVAARLEGIAEPGHIYVSSSVYDQIAGKLDLGFVDLGEQSLKNIDRPIRAYRVDREGRRTTVARKPRRASGAWIGAVLAVVALGAGVAWYVAQQSQGRTDEAAKARASAEAELAKARAEAEEARKAAAAATSSAEAAKRALEEQRIAQTRTRAQAELAAARAEAEATRRKADAELAAAAESRRAAEAAAKVRATPQATAGLTAAAPAASPKPAPPTPVKWAGTFACGPVGSAWPSTFTAAVTQVGNAFALAMGRAGQPGVLQMKGQRQPDGSLQLAGSGISSLRDFQGEAYKATISGKFSENRYQGRGTLGTRDCSLTLLTEAAWARQAATFPGPWTASFACAAQESSAPSTYQAAVTVTGQKYELRYGKAGEPGSAAMSGTREPDGRMRVAGKGISRMTEFYGQPYTLEFDGKFAGERYMARGKSGARDCVLSIARR